MTDCIEWPGNRDHHNYGRAWRNGCLVRAHRMVWEEANGPIPNGLVVRHTCDNPPCVNLDHLVLGTQAQNLADMRSRGRGRKSDLTREECSNGHAFTPENTYIGKTRKGSPTMVCRQCQRESQARHRQVELIMDQNG